MIRTQIQLEEAQYRALRERGVRTGQGLAQQVREAVGLYLARQDRAADPLDSVAGRFSPRPLHGLKPHDRDYTETIR
jgi:hypothetical protein